MVLAPILCQVLFGFWFVCLVPEAISFAGKESTFAFTFSASFCYAPADERRLAVELHAAYYAIEVLAASLCHDANPVNRVKRWKAATLDV